MVRVMRSGELATSTSCQGVAGGMRMDKYCLLSLFCVCNMAKIWRRVCPVHRERVAKWEDLVADRTLKKKEKENQHAPPLQITCHLGIKQHLQRI